MNAGWTSSPNYNVNTELVRERNNKVPTHDPHTNPNAHIYYSCECGDVLDPGTKSFAALNNAAMNTKWVISWRKNGQGYDAVCPKCAKGLSN